MSKPEKPSGRVVMEGRHNVWQWDDELDNTTIALKRLENADLSLEPTRTTRRLRQLRQEARAAARAEPATPAEPAPDETLVLELEGTFVFDAGGGFDPYNRS